MPKEGMNWWAWDTALWGMTLMMEDHEMFFEWSFKVVRRGDGEIGAGRLKWRRKNSYAAPSRAAYAKSLGRLF